MRDRIVHRVATWVISLGTPYYRHNLGASSALGLTLIDMARFAHSARIEHLKDSLGKEFPCVVVDTDDRPVVEAFATEAEAKAYMRGMTEMFAGLSHLGHLA